jgi:hypothetical protein
MAAALLLVQFSLTIAGLSVKPAPRQFPPLEKEALADSQWRLPLSLSKGGRNKS